MEGEVDGQTIALIPFTQSLSKDFSTFMIYSEAEREREQA
jgi:hypothetical protein